ncbi:SGNH/GDSL hydrolase family protein [Cesiribacter sp. SM1]|uniref:SGNH/GDSL hydrolase family protein n=1 Tax=Cesiribacter sp. SM1 TaxID=2861196 RepID=UPI001CD6BD5E|nr:SGNH/GDSL hydrolase family protein [Cesiribacter sp. SM1]
MKKLPYFLIFLLICSCLILPACAQLSKPPFWQEIQNFKEQDKQNPPPQDAILFVGSSSIRMWKSLESDFPERTVLNRGFGGSTLRDLDYYLNDIVLPYKPKQIIIYSGENDVAGGNISAEELLQRFQKVFEGIRAEMPRVPIAFVSMKPSPSREQYMPVLEEANALVKDYLKDKPNAQYIDIYNPMLDESGNPKADIFLEDKLHMNAKGYRIWTEVIEPYLVSE